ncbi:hypothetical protein F5887DRAFT_678721 [Amanita rubescens]|nr:hypothetical protein F5887DRAFT_678721 [Amanita rubescens]
MASALLKPSSRASESTWANAEKKLFDKDTQGFLTALAFQEVDYTRVDATLRKFVQLVDERLNPATNYVNLADVTQQSAALSPGKVIVEARGSSSTRTALRGHVDLDVGLCFPENFKILLEKDGEQVQRSIGQVLGALDLEDCLADPNVNGRSPSGNQIITKDGLHVVLLYVWGKLVSNNAGTFALKEEYSPANITAQTTMEVKVTTPLKIEIHPSKTLSTLTRSISARITEGPYPGLELDIFIDLITTRFAGQEVLVGVDKDGPLGVRQYRVETSIPSGKEWLAPNPLGVVDRTALLALKWWRNSIKDDTTIPDFQVSNGVNLEHGLNLLRTRSGIRVAARPRPEGDKISRSSPIISSLRWKPCTSYQQRILFISPPGLRFHSPLSELWML